MPPARLADTGRMTIREQSKCDDGGGEPSLRPTPGPGGGADPPAPTDPTHPVARAESRAPAVKPIWTAPRLTRYGDVRALTLGGSTGVFESGQPGTFRP